MLGWERALTLIPHAQPVLLLLLLLAQLVLALLVLAMRALGWPQGGRVQAQALLLLVKRCHRQPQNPQSISPKPQLAPLIQPRQSAATWAQSLLLAVPPELLVLRVPPVG